MASCHFRTALARMNLKSAFRAVFGDDWLYTDVGRETRISANSNKFAFDFQLSDALYGLKSSDHA